MKALLETEVFLMHAMAYSKGKNSPKPLTGKALLKRFAELEGMKKSDQAKACGYVKRSRTGKDQARLSAFMNALLEAKGVYLDSRKSSTGKQGSSLSYRVQVQRNGLLMIGGGYTKKMGLKPGQSFEVHLRRQGLQLVSIDPAQEDCKVD